MKIPFDNPSDPIFKTELNKKPSKEELFRFHNNGIIKYVGNVDNVKEIISDSKIVVLPSYYGEGLPKILIEAAACGIPIITTDHPGCRDAIIENLRSFLDFLLFLQANIENLI